MQHRDQADAVGDPERVLELLGGSAALVVGKPEPDHTAIRVLGGEPGEGPCVERVPRAVGGDHDADADAEPRACGTGGVQDELGEGGGAPETGGVPAGVDLDLQPAGPVGPLVLGDLVDEPAYV